MLARSDDGSLWSINRATGAAVRGGTLLIGGPALRWDTDSVGRSSTPAERQQATPWGGVILRANGTVSPVPLPPNTSFRWMGPLAVEARDGAADVIWGTRPDSGGSPILATALWHARFDGIVWTTPTRIAEADAIWWDGSPNAAIRVGENLHVVTRAYDNTRGPRPWMGAIYVRGSGDRWTATPIHPPDFFPRYTAWMATDARDLRIIYTGSVRDSASVEQNGLASIESTDGGATWGAPVLIRHLTGKTGYWLQATHNESGYSLVWAGLAETDTGSSRVSGLTSRDARRWNSMPDVVVAGNIAGLASVPTPNGNDLEVVFQSGRGELQTAVWRGGRWLPVTRISSQAATVGAVTAGDGGRVLLTWNEMKELPNGHRVPVLMVSERRACHAAS